MTVLGNPSKILTHGCSHVEPTLRIGEWYRDDVKPTREKDQFMQESKLTGATAGLLQLSFANVCHLVHSSWCVSTFRSFEESCVIVSG
jgi:hypothetical protein